MKTTNSILFIALQVALGIIKFSSAYSTITLSTTSTIPGEVATPSELYRFFASPANWPKIVASSHSVVSPTGGDLEKPLKTKERVDEIFGLPPILPLSVTWRLEKSIPPTRTKPGFLEFYSKNGLRSIASDCRMQFEIYEGNKESLSGSEKSESSVKLTMSYDPQSPLATLATPVLAVDNAIALKVLLPSVLSSQAASPLNDFRRLMGTLYGIAGVAHLADCLTDSKLLTAANSGPFFALPPLGQMYALLWCAAGPLSFSASLVGGLVADFGLILYGSIEVFGAYLLQLTGDAVSPSVLVNALVVQGIVAAAWNYSA
eukprot:CAMPEP_0194254368 /NCGR_PEP_ID=MMETSP0158-20130606/31989_1 /TAXON_ID=33649 /ORGANISM="Thalassionema nitzschioides, Strain L26-B" /LENGTH=316 /DNA_ID=CAMNT_0038992369 /DNA_START=1 /DNA_END=947 /DNA_ORIENTATION=+